MGGGSQAPPPGPFSQRPFERQICLPEHAEAGRKKRSRSQYARMAHLGLALALRKDRNPLLHQASTVAQILVSVSINSPDSTLFLYDAHEMERITGSY